MQKKVKKKRFKFRLFIFFVFFGFVISFLGYSFFLNIYKIREMKKEKLKLENKIAELVEEEEALESDIQKLADPSYVARYAREKYLYSKDGELIIRIEE